VRDLAELRALGLPVYARSVSPATAVGRYASVSKQVPVECAGVIEQHGRTQHLLGAHKNTIFVSGSSL